MRGSKFKLKFEETKSLWMISGYHKNWVQWGKKNWVIFSLKQTTSSYDKDNNDHWNFKCFEKF